jgi:hypothetical protein
MSTEQSSSNKWLIGCLIAGVVGLLLCGGVVVFFGVLGYRAAQQIQAELGPEFEKQMERLAYVQTWRAPPADAGPDQLLPPTFGGWTLSGHDDAAAIPELAIEREGVHGTYESAGTTVNVYAYRVPMTEQTQVFEAASTAIDEAGYSSKSQAQMDYGSMHWMTFEFNPPQRTGRLWWANDWLFVMMTETPAVNLESFENDYLDTIQAPPVPGMDDSSSTEPVEPVDETPPQPDEPVDSTPDGADPASEVTAPAESETAPDSPDASSSDTAPAEPESSETAPADPNEGAQ